jgi:hypothetical protein
MGPSAGLRPPTRRRLQVYAFDPYLGTRLETARINRLVLSVPWEAEAPSPAPGGLEGQPPGEGCGPGPCQGFGPGPVGEYLEVLDYDPASGCYYDPVNLNDPFLLAQDGLDPSEGNPQFHQQMVYAVAMTTIGNFEQALGRRALWAPHLGGRDDYVGRLRAHPHAFRGQNAFYSPKLKALLFGYFPATASDPGNYLPGGTVFTCLSHDIIAHETSHALLDGMHRYFIEPSNPDVLAFHEAFADIVALFQHFSYPEVLRSQIARTRGDLASQSLLGELAWEFGRATGLYGPLRGAIGSVNPETGQWEPHRPDPTALGRLVDPHDRGAILVAAVFAAFLSIYRARVADLLRIATGGTGVLPAGELHPDLVGRLADEAAKSARHVLNMCIRALDYCPPVDPTFGEYLRALITADYELVPDDDRNYRTAVIDAFRSHGIYPRDVRALSLDSLLWQPPGQRLAGLFLGQEGLLAQFRELAGKWTMVERRREVHDRARKAQLDLHTWLDHNRGAFDPDDLGLKLDGGPSAAEGWGSPEQAKFEVHSIRPARRISPDGDTDVNLVIEITQKLWARLQGDGPLSAGPTSPDEQGFWFRGGCTLLVDPDTGEIRYCVYKHVTSRGRLERARQFYGGQGLPPGLTYRGPRPRELVEEPFALLHSARAEWDDR